jgi:hypothetical protein
MNSRLESHEKHIQNLSSHQDLVHDGLIDHRDQVRNFSKAKFPWSLCMQTCLMELKGIIIMFSSAHTLFLQICIRIAVTTTRTKHLWRRTTPVRSSSKQDAVVSECARKHCTDDESVSGARAAHPLAEQFDVPILASLRQQLRRDCWIPGCCLAHASIAPSAVLNHRNHQLAPSAVLNHRNRQLAPSAVLNHRNRQLIGWHGKSLPLDIVV